MTHDLSNVPARGAVRPGTASAVLCLALSAVCLAASAGSYTVDRSNYSIPAALAEQPGDAERGRAIAIDRKKGNCLACHEMPIPEQPFHGEVGPPLNDVGARYDASQLRLRVVDPKLLNPMSIMPSFYRIEGLHRVADKFQGKTILSAQEVEDVIAYLQTLK